MVAGQLGYVAGFEPARPTARYVPCTAGGVCRDFAHLCIALLRAFNAPARMAGVFAPGLSPMEYHAVCEAYVTGGWYIVDATRLAPRRACSEWPPAAMPPTPPS